jgi:hypothetical protein
MAYVTYSIQSNHGYLIDGGANIRLRDADVYILELTLKTPNVLGLDAHLVSDIPLATVSGVIQSTQGNIIGIFTTMHI